MDNKGFVSIQYLFYIFILILMATGILFIAMTYVDSAQNIELHSTIRIVLDGVCDDINQVNSNGEGYSKKIQLPDNILGFKYSLEVSNKKIIFKGAGRTAANEIIPVNLVKDDIRVDHIDLYGGNSYIIKKYDKSQVSIIKAGW